MSSDGWEAYNEENQKNHELQKVIEEAYDLLAGMWSWNDNYLDNVDKNWDTWITLAGKKLRTAMSRPAARPKDSNDV